MRRITTSQLAALCVCVVYLAAVAFFMSARAAMSFFKLGSEYPEAYVPREALMGVANLAAQSSRWDALLVIIAFLMLAAVVLWITKNPKI